MCVTLGEARLEKTLISVSVGSHPTAGPVHVLMYSNRVRNLQPGPNAMLLHVPAERIGAENALDLTQARNVLTDLRSSGDWMPAMASSGARSLGGAEIFEAGEYTVVSAEDPTLIPDALQRVPEEKRPAINEELFSWYRDNLPGYVFLLACFNNQAAAEAAPFGVWYRSWAPDFLVAPGLDAHDGRPPVAGQPVKTDHAIMFGDMEVGKLMEAEYSDTLTPDLRELLPKGVVTHYEYSVIPNGDWVIPVERVRDMDVGAVSRRLLHRN